MYFTSPKMNEAETLIFVHIPRTAGRTLETVLNRQYSHEEIYDIYGWDMNIPQAAERLKRLPEKQKRKIKLIKGHYQFGLHKDFPQTCSYITFFRDPIVRVISHYYYILRQDRHPFNAIVKSNNLTLGEYVASGISIELDNGQARLISGIEKYYEFGKCKEDVLDRAKSNLKEHFSAFGLTERFNESLAMMSLRFGWSKIYYMKRNVTLNRPSKREISKNTLRTIERYNALDCELYEYAEKIFETSIEKCASLLHGQLRKIRWQSNLFQSCRKLIPTSLYKGLRLNYVLGD